MMWTGADGHGGTGVRPVDAARHGDSGSGRTPAEPDRPHLGAPARRNAYSSTKVTSRLTV